MKVIVTFSGGKDSLAALLWTREHITKNFTTVFCDTGWEHPLTYEYIHRIADKLHLDLVTLKSKKYDGMVDLARHKKRWPSPRFGAKTEKEMNTNAMFSSVMDTWSTPQDFFDRLDAEFHFTLDPCATPENAKCGKFYTREDDGLSQDWGGETVFCNPPYGRTIYDWVKKCYEESRKPNTTVVMLIPARTDTWYFHEFVYHKAKEIRFVKGRLKFGNAKYNAPFPSMVVVF